MKITDANGVVYTTKELDPGDVLELLEAAGDASSNAGWVRYAMVVASITAINDVPIPQHTSKQDIVMLAKKIGNVGITAITSAMFGPAKAPAMAALAEVETAKN
jgi:hypothetical protein